MGLSKKPYRGTRDLFPLEKRKQDYLFTWMHQTAQSFAYEHYDGPLLEEVELYKAKSGDELINEQIYSFQDRGERLVAIRPEMTPTLARMVAQVHKEIPKPIRWYSIPNLMRYEKPQKGRLREHWQFNCDIFGADSILGTVEIIQVAIQLLRNFGAHHEHFSVNLNDRHVVEAFFKEILQLDDENAYKLYKVIDKSKKVGPEALKEMIQQNLPDESKQKTFQEYISLKTIDDLMNFSQTYKIDHATSEIAGVVQKLKELEFDVFLEYDPTIVRGLDYYTGVVFEIFDKHPQNKRAICGGGAYGNLLQIFGDQPLAGVGFGLGDVTLLDFLESHNLLPNKIQTQEIDLIISYQDNENENLSIKLAQELRQHQLKVEIYYGAVKPKKVFQLTDKKGHRFAAFVGNEKIELRNISKKQSENFNHNDLQNIISHLKGTSQ